MGEADIHATGNALDNELYGNSGSNILDGLDGSDWLDGGDGDDILQGGNGADTMTGGAGEDVFQISGNETGLGSAADRIEDFGSGEDAIDLSGIDASVPDGGDQAFTFIGSNAFSGTAGELRYSVEDSETWLLADINGDSVADLQIILSGAPIPLAGDFVL